MATRISQRAGLQGFVQGYDGEQASLKARVYHAWQVGGRWWSGLLHDYSIYIYYIYIIYIIYYIYIIIYISIYLCACVAYPIYLLLGVLKASQSINFVVFVHKCALSKCQCLDPYANSYTAGALHRQFPRKSQAVWVMSCLKGSETEFTQTISDVLHPTKVLKVSHRHQGWMQQAHWCQQIGADSQTAFALRNW